MQTGTNITLYAPCAGHPYKDIMDPRAKSAEYLRHLPKPAHVLNACGRLRHIQKSIVTAYMMAR
ncbi:MAG TPA: hypothetical protein VK452_05340 [Dissulfurispiraceae bacterium]|nr:hypothetical protein [Dissulfurispiraceae bacterium]